MSASERELGRLRARFAGLLRRRGSVGELRLLRDTASEILRAYRDHVAVSGSARREWRGLARQALALVGADADPQASSLRDYDHELYGPYLGVSDEGSAAEAIVRAAADSPKARVLGSATPLEKGLAIDLERLGAIGEVIVGPDEYQKVWLEAASRILTSTDVGTRVNVRHYLPVPLVTIPGGPVEKVLPPAREAILAAFKPFLGPVKGEPRPLTVFVEFELSSRRPIRQKRQCLRRLAADLRAARKAGEAAGPGVHELGLNARIGWGRRGLRAAQVAIDLALGAGLRDVSVDGVQRKAADAAGSLPGLLNYLPPGCVGPLLRYAKRRGLKVQPRHRVDPDTVARGVWSSLFAARAMGLHLGKYGLFPLTLEEGDRVVELIQGWFDDWSAAPVFFVDQGLLSSNAVYAGNDRVAGLELWLEHMSRRKVRVVLIDTVDKSRGWRLLRAEEDPKGLLGAKQVARVAGLAARKRIKALWAGGITLPQAYQFGKIGVFGLYVTTAVADVRPVSRSYRRDPMMAYEKEPTYQGVLRLKTLVEAGFLETRPKLARRSAEIASRASEFLEALDKGSSRVDKTQAELAAASEDAWREHLRASGVRVARKGSR